MRFIVELHDAYCVSTDFVTPNGVVDIAYTKCPQTDTEFYYGEFVSVAK